jgi:hypothetical protein
MCWSGMFFLGVKPTWRIYEATTLTPIGMPVASVTIVFSSVIASHF